MKLFFKSSFIFTLLVLMSIPAIVDAQDDNHVETVIQKGHIQPVTCVAFHPSGAYFASGSLDQSIKIWNVQSGKIIRTINIHTSKILNLSFSKDGKKLLSSDYLNNIYVTDILTGDVLEKYHYKSDRFYFMDVAFSADESHILAGSNRDNFFVINREKHNHQVYEKGFSATVHPNSLIASNNKVVDFNNYKYVNLIDLNYNDTLKLDFDKAYHYSFSPDGKQLLVGSSKLFATAFDVASGQELFTLTPNKEKQCDGCNIKLTYSSDGKRIATYDRYSGISIWNAKNGKLQFQINTGETRFTELKFSPLTNYIFISNDDYCFVYNLKTKAKVFDLKSDFLDNYVPKFSPDESALLIADKNNTITKYRVKQTKKSKTYSGLGNDNSNALSYDYSRWIDIGILNFLKYKTPMEIAPNGDILAQGKIDSTIILTNINTGRTLKALKGHPEQVVSLAFSPDSTTLASGDASGLLIIWDTKTWKIKHKIKAHYNVIFDLAYNTDGSEILSSSWDGDIKHWNVSTSDKIGQIHIESSSAYKIGFSKDDLYILLADLDHKIYLYETDTKEKVQSYIGHTNTVSDFEFDAKTNQIISTSWDGSVRFWDFKSGILNHKLKLNSQSTILSVTLKNESSQLFLGCNDRKIICYDYKKKQIIKQFTAHQSGVSELKIHPQLDVLYSRSVAGEIKVWNANDYSEKMTFLQINENDWLVSQPQGYFDGTSNAMKYINYVSGMKALEVGSFFKKYYYPNLYKQIQNGKRFINEEQGINSMMNDIPLFELQFKNFQNEITYAKSDTTYTHTTNSVTLDILLQEKYDNIASIRVYNNGKLIKDESFTQEVVFRGNKTTRSVDIELIPKLNNISFELITTDGVTTPRKTVSLNYDSERGKTDIFILSLGINEYENPKYNLNFAKNDAQSFIKSLSKSSAQIFDHVYEYSLYSKNVTKENVLEKIEEIKKTIGPEDVFVFFYAGHGIMSEKRSNAEGDFFLVMSDITNLYGDYEMLKNKGFSADELLNISKEIVAQKQIYVLDACQSGGALNALAVRGVAQEKSMAQLARSSGTFILTASQDFEYANEASSLKHGLFTYAILEILNGTASDVAKDETISIYQLKSYVESRVPELSKLHNGSPQFPTGYSFGNDFPIGVVK